MTNRKMLKTLPTVELAKKIYSLREKELTEIIRWLRSEPEKNTENQAEVYDKN